MRIPRIFHPAALAAHARIALEGNAARHLGRVLRLTVGDELLLFDGTGGEYPAHIVEQEKQGLWVVCGERQERSRESPLQLTLAQGVSKGERMDYTIQKAVELGISRIVPVATERSVVNLKGERLQRRMEHWRGVIISACEQCGRNTLPELLPLNSLGQWLQQPLDGRGLLLDHRATMGSSELELLGNACTLLIGPEGGLSEREQGAARAAGYLGLRLGPRVLRTETAALAALAAIQSRWGDLG
ncbi:MAG: 16S rRNA (uracil(1498)-N(3))-methyltransferase [Gammaproteobacteria bacterium]|nr:16S rRNA (uracil(1498)-N(3))-methyltransferase [Gammaproteobacteria bacterium]